MSTLLPSMSGTTMRWIAADLQDRARQAAPDHFDQPAVNNGASTALSLLAPLAIRVEARRFATPTNLRPSTTLRPAPSLRRGAPTHGRLCPDVGNASRRSLTSLPRSASAADVRLASCQTSLARHGSEASSNANGPRRSHGRRARRCHAFGAKRVRSAPRSVPKNHAEAALAQAVRVTTVGQPATGDLATNSALARPPWPQRDFSGARRPRSRHECATARSSAVCQLR